MSRTRILTIGIDKVTLQQAVDRCVDFMRSGKAHLVVTPNAEVAYAAQHDADLNRIVNEADLVVADGAGIVLAAKLLGNPVPEKVAGVELATRLLAELERMDGTVYLLGASPESLAKAVAWIRERHPGLTVHHRDGYFKPEEEPAVLADIRLRQPQLLLAALGVPRQEKWLDRHLAELGVPLGIGVGGTIDAWSGTSPRAPQWMINANLEWAYRVVKFGRFGRSLPPLVKFMLQVMVRRLRGG